MKLQIEIPDEKTENLSNKAEARLKKVVEDYSGNILDEASRIESTRNNGNKPEITAIIIDDAVEFTKKFSYRKKNSNKKIWAMIIAFISTVFTGGLFKTEKFNEPEYLFAFLGAFLFSVISNLYIFLNDNNNE
jgi:hypothetical protein